MAYWLLLCVAFGGLIVWQLLHTVLPYNLIAGVNEHAAVLHHFNLDTRVVEPRSFLIDKGGQLANAQGDIIMPPKKIPKT